MLAVAAMLAPLGASASDARFGYLLPSVRNVQLANIPQRDRYAKGIAESIAAAASITAVPIPAHAPGGLDLQMLCKSLNLAGVIDPYVGWTANDDAVTAQASAVVMDCNGKQFFLDQASDVANRDAKLTVDEQSDARMAAASSKLAKRFVTPRTWQVPSRRT